MSSEHFSPDPDLEELQWAKKFVEALAKKGGPTYSIAGRAPEPGDALLVRGGGEPDVYLQITEAVDTHRVAMVVKRDRYTQIMWRAAPTLKTEFPGLQFFFDDAGLIAKFPQPSSPQAEAFARMYAQILTNSAGALRALPVGHWSGCLLREATTGAEVMSRVHRYAEAGPAKWLWGGTVRIFDDTPLPDYIRDVVLGKLQHPECLKYKGKNPLWLLAFTRDCTYDIEQEKAIQAAAASGSNPFERIYFFRDNVRRIFPPGCELSAAPGPKPKAVIECGSDYLAQPFDTRFRDIE